MPFDYGLRLNNRQRIANARAKPIEANKNQSVDGAEALFLRSGSPQNVYLLPQRQNFRLERCPRPTQVCDHPNNEPDKISHPAAASPDSPSTASQIEFATGTAVELLSAAGTFLAAVAAVVSVSSIILDETARPVTALLISFGWAAGATMQIVAGIIARMRANASGTSQERLPHPFVPD
jgi:hypothetical protein